MEAKVKCTGECSPGVHCFPIMRNLLWILFHGDLRGLPQGLDQCGGETRGNCHTQSWMDLTVGGKQLAGGLAAVLEQTFAMAAHKNQKIVCKTCQDIIDALRVSWLFWGQDSMSGFWAFIS